MGLLLIKAPYFKRRASGFAIKSVWLNGLFSSSWPRDGV